MARRPACSSSTSSSSPSTTDASRAPAAAFTADRGDHAHRLDHALLRRAGLHGLSRARLQRLVAEGRVHVNGRPAHRAAERLRAGDVVRIEVEPKPVRGRPAAEALPVEVVYEDDDLVVVNKPAGQVAHPSYRNASGTLLNALLGLAAQHGGQWQPHLTQRLDKDTSGLLMAAKSSEVQAALQLAAIDKEYLALVWGRPVPPAGRIEAPVGRDPLDRRRMMVREHGAAAVTEYRTLARTRGPARGLALLSCRLVTGRTHQLRVHLADGGWPLVGDAVYRAGGGPRLADPRLHRAAAGFARQALHAWRLRFAHPRTGVAMAFEAAVPDDLRSLLEDLAVRVPAG